MDRGIKTIFLVGGKSLFSRMSIKTMIGAMSRIRSWAWEWGEKRIAVIAVRLILFPERFALFCQK